MKKRTNKFQGGGATSIFVENNNWPAGIFTLAFYQQQFFAS